MKKEIQFTIKKCSEVNLYIFLRWTSLFGKFFSYILSGKWNFSFLQKRFSWIKSEPLVKNGWLRACNFRKIYRNIFFFIIKTESSLFTSVFIFSTISQILKTKFDVLRKQTCRKDQIVYKWTCYFSHNIELYFRIRKLVERSRELHPCILVTLNT